MESKLLSLYGLILLFLFSCESANINLQKQKDKEYFSKVESFLAKEKSSLHLLELSTDSTGRKLVVDFNFRESSHVFSNDVIALQEFLVLDGISYAYIAAVEENGKYSLFDKTTLRLHRKCLKTMRVLSKALIEKDSVELRNTIDENSLNEEKVLELLEFTGKVNSVDILAYWAMYDDFYGEQKDNYTICLNQNYVVNLIIDYESPELIMSFDVVGDNCIIPKAR